MENASAGTCGILAMDVHRRPCELCTVFHFHGCHVVQERMVYICHPVSHLWRTTHCLWWGVHLGNHLFQVHPVGPCDDCYILCSNYTTDFKIRSERRRRAKFVPIAKHLWTSTWSLTKAADILVSILTFKETNCLHPQTARKRHLHCLLEHFDVKISIMLFHLQFRVASLYLLDMGSLAKS